MNNCNNGQGDERQTVLLDQSDRERQTQEREKAEAVFLQTYPAYTNTGILDAERAQAFARLDEQGHVYLDYTGGGLYAEGQVREHTELLLNSVFGNPHSENPTSLAMTKLVEQVRAYVLAYFNVPLDEYVAIFTPNASAALKHVGESYPFGPGDHYLLTADNHNSVNGIREFARVKGATVTYLPVVRPEMRIDEATLPSYLDRARPDRNNLFAFPAQSNYTGVQHPLEMIEQARCKGWDVLVDCAAFVPTNRLDLYLWRPDFVSLSFYKIFGYPTGIGCLLARRPALAKLRRPWFAGGTISIASVLGDGHYLVEGEAAYEDGTVNYLNLPAVESGLRYIERLGIETIHTRVTCLTGWLLEKMTTLHHSNGETLVCIHGPCNTERRGGTITFNFLDPHGEPFDVARIEELANQDNISLRTGCFCNPGAGEIAKGLSSVQMVEIFQRPEGMPFWELRKYAQNEYAIEVSSVRISVGLATNFADVYRFYQFARYFLNRSADEIGAPSDYQTARAQRDSA